MNIGFFADDMSASQAALLASGGLSGHAPGAPGVLAGSNALAEAIPDYLDAATASGRHLMIALPLAQLSNLSIRSRIDLAVIAFGPSLVARDGAFRAMTAECTSRTATLAPPWLLSASGRSRHDPPHTLPVRMTMLRPYEAAEIRRGCRCGGLHRRAVGLAAALRIAADDPYAPSLDPAEVANLLAADGASTTLTDADIALREDLLDLADDLDRGPGLRRAPTDWRRRPAAADRRPGRRGSLNPTRSVGNRAVRPPPATVRHAADCPRSAIAIA